MEGVLLCSYKLTSKRFLDKQLSLVRSIGSYSTICSIPGAMELLRDLLWAESLDAPDPLHPALRRLARDGQVVILEDQ